MSITYEIFQDRDFIVTRFSSAFTLNEVLEYRKRLLADPAYSAAYPRLIDMRGISTPFTANEIHQLAESMVRTPGSTSGARRAMVADMDLIYGLSRMLEALSESGAERWRAFRSVEEAEVWLGVREPPQ